jgi:hypothetical protein
MAKGLHSDVRFLERLAGGYNKGPGDEVRAEQKTGEDSLLDPSPNIAFFAL